MPVVIITVGLPASGKSTWAKKHIKTAPGKWKRVNKDDLRAMLDDGSHSKPNESFVLNTRDQIILAAVEDDTNVIVDDTNIHPKHEKRIRELVKGKATVEIKSFMDVSVAECVKRNAGRTGLARVPQIAIRSMYNQWKRNQGMPEAKVPEYDPKLSFAIICDIDGTLALVGNRNPYDTAHADRDHINPPIKRILTWAWADKREKPDILLITGRDDKYDLLTRTWLKSYGVIYTNLYMRKSGDRRKDIEVKKEIFERHIKGKYNVLFVLEDRKQVCAMYREELGLTVLQVAEGDY